MEEIKILVVALVSFLSPEYVPIVAKSAEIHIDRKNRQVTITQNDLFSVEEYREAAKTGLDFLMRQTTLRPEMAPLHLVSTNFYEEDGKLNAILHLQYDDLEDLRKMSFYADNRGTLSYSYLDDFEYGLQTGRIDDKYVCFDNDFDVNFRMERKGAYPKEIFSLLEDWKEIVASNYVNVTNEFSVKDFKKARRLILENGLGRSFRNIENNNPFYQFDSFGAFLASSTKYQVDHRIPLETEDYNEMVLWGDGQFTLYLYDERTPTTNSYLKNDKVYFLKSDHLDIKALVKYMKEIRTQL